MSNFKLKGIKAETILAKSLWNLGIRYRKIFKKLPGSPDITIIKYKIAIFFDGELWHGFDWENRKQKLKKIKNIGIDKRNIKLLEQNNWKVSHCWGKKVVINLNDYIEKIICEIEKTDAIRLSHLFIK